MDGDCPFCERLVLTELYCQDEWVWIVRDLNKRRYNLRVLIRF